MDLMEQTDMLIVAGGDGTLQEVKHVGVISLESFECFAGLSSYSR